MRDTNNVELILIEALWVIVDELIDERRILEDFVSNNHTISHGTLLEVLQCCVVAEEVELEISVEMEWCEKLVEQLAILLRQSHGLKKITLKIHES
jgi:hypothetical protein